MDYFLLCIKADQYNFGRKRRAVPEYDFSKVISDQYLFLLVTVLDINDQTPYFTNTQMTTTGKYNRQVISRITAKKVIVEVTIFRHQHVNRTHIVPAQTVYILWFHIFSWMSKWLDVHAYLNS